MTFASMFRSDKEFITNCPVLVRSCETIRSFQSSLILFLSKTNNCRKSVRFIVWIHSYFYLLSIVRSAVKEWEFIRILADFSRSGQWRNSTTKIFHWDLGPLGLWGRKQCRACLKCGISCRTLCLKIVCCLIFERMLTSAATSWWSRSLQVHEQ